MSDDNLTLGIQAAKAGKREQARSHLAKAIQLDPGSEEGWLWLGHSMDEQEKRKYCYQRVLALNPANSEAWRSLDELTNPPAESAAASVPPQPAEPEPVPESGPDKDEKASQNKKRERFWPTVLFGFLLTLILVALPAGAIILTGHLDNLLISKNITILPPMPPIYEHWVDSVVTPTPIPIPAGPFDDRFAKAGPLLVQANNLLLSNNCAEALPVLDQALLLIPDDDIPYYQRAMCYSKLTENQRSLNETLSNTYNALADINQAIHIQPDKGDYYAERGLIYYRWAGLEELAVNRNYLYQIAIDNLQAASALGTTIYYPIDPTIISSMILSGQCQGGLARAQDFISESKLVSLHYADVYLMEAQAYACLGQLDQALETVRTTMTLGTVSGDQKMLEATILYQMGYPDEALQDLDNLIVQMPQYNGERYYLRALIYFKKGNRDEAYRSMLAGSGNTWFHGGLYTYVQGQMGLQLAGPDNRAKSIEALQYAEASLDVTFNVFKKRVQSELLMLGAQPLEPAVSIPVNPTPVPDFVPQPTARFTSTPTLFTIPTFIPTSNPSWTQTPTSSATRTPAEKTISPSASPTATSTPTRTAPAVIYTPPDDNLTIVDIQVGTGPVILSGNERKILRFQPAEALSIQDVQSLTIHLQGSDTQSAPAFLVELWNPYEGSWTSLQPRLGDTRVSYPNNYVLPEGDIYIAIRNMTGLPLEMQDLTIQVVIMDQNGNLAFYGTE